MSDIIIINESDHAVQEHRSSGCALMLTFILAGAFLLYVIVHDVQVEDLPKTALMLTKEIAVYIINGSIDLFRALMGELNGPNHTA